VDEIHETPALCLRPVHRIGGLKPKYPLRGTTITIGRHPANDISIPVESVSRFHARLEKQRDRFLLVDLNSSNGTYVNAKRIESTIIEPGQTIAFGNVEFVCEREDEEKSRLSSDLLKTPVEIVGRERKQSHLILEAEAGKRDTVQLIDFIKAPPERESLEKAYRQLAALYKLSDILRSAPEEQRLLESFMDLIFEVLPADRGVILLRDDPESELRIRVARSRDPSGDDTPIAISRTIIDRCMKERLAILSQDATADERFKASESILLHDIRSTMVVPIATKNLILGVLHIDTRESVRAFNDDDLHFVTNLADDLALYLDHRRMMEENLRNQEMAAVGEVITQLAHSIKNILLLAEGGLNLMDRLIDEGDLDKIRQTWGLTQKTLARISTMVKEMLDYSRAPELTKTPCNLNRIVRETCESFKTEFENKGITVKLRLDRRIDDTMLDAKGLERSLINLLVNACEAIKHDHGEIVITTKLRANHDLVLIVEDNGEGIPEDKISRIFLPKFSTKSGAGTGLGLAMVKKWAAAVGGTVRVYSTEGKGTRFVITLPRESVAVTQADTS